MAFPLRKTRRLGLACAFLCSCTYGGSNEDPRLGIGTDPEIDFGMIDASMSGGDDLAPSSPNAPSAPSAPGKGATADGGRMVMNGVDAGGRRVDAGMVGGACGPAEPSATCDPVRNTGCPPLTQCDIETSATAPTGRCVFFMAAPGLPCSSSFVSVACDAQNTCVGGECRKMCYCDSDCPTGQCCNDSSGPGPAGVFKLCRPC